MKFRVHYRLKGAKATHETEASKPQIAAAEVRKLFPGAVIDKTKALRNAQ